MADLDAIRSYVGRFDPIAAAGLIERILEATRILEGHPHMGRRGRDDGTRDLVVTGTPYLMPYRVRGQELSVLRVYHGARRWPKRLWADERGPSPGGP